MADRRQHRYACNVLQPTADTESLLITPLLSQSGFLLRTFVSDIQIYNLIYNLLSLSRHAVIARSTVCKA